QQIARQEAKLERERHWRLGLMVGLLILCVLGGVLAYLYLRLQQAKREVERLAEATLATNVSLEASLQEQIMLQGELHHRVKNNLQIIISLLEMQGDDIKDAGARERLQVMGERIHSMAAIHEILYTREGVSNASFPEYVHRLCRHFMQLSSPTNSPRFEFDLEEVWFDLETLMPVGIILNELLTNTRKYATRKGVETVIGIKLTSQNGKYTLTYRDNGPGFSTPQMESREGGLGSYLLDSMSRQLRGEVSTFNDGGAVVKLQFRAVDRRNASSLALGDYRSEQEPYHSEQRVQAV
ncbi:MAG: sensor histidine kinase, partial [Bacteroidota bacterium]